MSVQPYYPFRLFSILQYLLLAFALVITSCNDDKVDPLPPLPSALVEATLVYTLTATQIQMIAELTGFTVDANKFSSDVDIYKVTYNTTYKGGRVVASGLVAIPETTQAVPVLSYQHGTITRDEDAPSNFTVSSSETLVAGASSSLGFVTVIPDYVGFGSTTSNFHPYYVEDETAISVKDMIKAALELAVDKKIALNKKLFLAGYSEGGYATMAAHKAIEADGVADLELVASFPGAGAYDLEEMQAWLFAKDTYEDPFYLGYIAMSYYNTYSFNTLLTDFFQEPYAARMPKLFDNQKTSGEINSQLTTSIADLIQPAMRTGLHTEARFKYLADAFANNSLTDWKPTKPMYMYHGTSDTTVPFENSQHTYEALIANGASPTVVTLISLPGDHTSAVTPYVADLMMKLWDLK